MKPRDKLAQEIRTLSQPAQRTEAQINFERFLKCQEQRDTSNMLADALQPRERWHAVAAPLIAPSHILPPMF